MGQLTKQDASFGIEQFVSARRKEQEPPRGTVLWQLWNTKRLTTRQAWSAGRFYDDVILGLADSGGHTKAIDLSVEKVDMTRRIVDLPGSMSPEHRARERLARLVSYIRPSEGPFMVEMVRDYHLGELARQKNLRRFQVHFDIETLGRIVSGYHGRAQAQAAGVARLQGLLDVIGDFYEEEAKE